MSIKKKIVYRASLALAPFVFRLLTKLLFATCRVTVRGEEYRQQVEGKGQKFIAAFWHYSIVYIIFLSRGLPWVCMVSASKDGEYISRILEGLGYKTVRGSKSGGGMRALKGMVGAVKDGLNAAIVADGSKGPARIAQAGAVLVASKTGVPIVPVAWAADRYLAFRSWDRTVLPKPFARLKLVYGAPIAIPAKISAAQLEEYRQQLEEGLNGVYRQAWGAFAREGH